MATNRSAPPPEDETPATDDSRQSWFDVIEDHWLEFVTVLLLASASLAVAWGGYQSARWGGVQSTLYSKAGAVRVESTRSETTSQLLAITDLSIFNECADENAPSDDTLKKTFSGDRARSEQSAALDLCYADQFTPELLAVMEAWFETQPLQNPTNPDAPSRPTQVDQVVRRELVQSKQLEAEAERLFAEGQAANQRSDNYVLTTVFLATVLFFGGISSRLTWRPMRIGFISFAATLLGFSLCRLATFPVM